MQNNQTRAKPVDLPVSVFPSQVSVNGNACPRVRSCVFIKPLAGSDRFRSTAKQNAPCSAFCILIDCQLSWAGLRPRRFSHRLPDDRNGGAAKNKTRLAARFAFTIKVTGRLTPLPMRSSITR
jgi:hypothetical protein